jgi:hypothetical protein
VDVEFVEDTLPFGGFDRLNHRCGHWRQSWAAEL